MSQARWLISLAILSLALALVLYTGHTPWLIRVLVLGLALVALLFYTERTRWLIGGGVLGLALVLLFYRLGDGSLYDWDEATYAQVAKEMVLSQTWGTLYWNGAPFFKKLPLYFWLTALTYQLIGINEFAARLWPAIFGLGVLVLTFILGLRMRSWLVGMVAILLLLIGDHHVRSYSYNFLGLSRVGMLDVPLTFWIMAAVLLAWEAQRQPWLITLIGIPTGLAVMTKAWPGGFALVIPFIYWLFTRPSRSYQIRYWITAGVVAGVVSLPWHLWQYWVHGYPFFHEYVSVNLTGRLSGRIDQPPRGPLFYLEILRRGFSYWAVLGALAYLWGVWRALRQRDRWTWLLLSWITLPLLVFSLAQTKLNWYISPIYPALALLIGTALAELLTDRVAFGMVGVVMAICCIRFAGLADGSPEVKQFVPHVAPYIETAATVYVFEEGPRPYVPYMSALSAGKPVHPGKDTQARICHPALRFYINRPLPCIDARDIDDGLLPQDAYVIISRKSWEQFGSHLGRVVFEGDAYILVQGN
jgi:4-amino-4-deoxy-L-arabinose transferase-like glycosyltransferase